MTVLFAIIAGFLLDCIFGDPHALPHPVRLMGLLVTGGEKVLRKISCKTPQSRLVCGVLLTLVVVLLSFAVPFFILFVLARMNFYLALAVQSFMCYQIIAAKSLRVESMKVSAELERVSLVSARQKLSWIVGRDTQNLDEAHIIRAAVETVAENTSDGVTAPLLYLLIGGAPLGFLYKAVNTLDSMIGYKNEKYLHFGRFAARLDDVFNFVPARLTGILMAPAAALIGLDGRGAFRIFRRDRKKHHSPNSACTEAACAGALGIQLGGDSTYFGKLVKKPTIGDDHRPVEVEDIRRANRLMYVTTVLFLIIGGGLRFLILWSIL
ncbi:MAG: adenosylcobinamide-phosphate synthase CbiB [Ethanoligenens sp.]